MKDAKILVKHIYDNPLFKELKNADECRELRALMPRAQQNFIAFCYVRQGALFFVLTHPLMLSELKRDSSINMIKGLLKAFVKTRENSVFKDVRDVKFFVTEKLRYRPAPKERKILFRPKSDGNFQILAKDEILKAKFGELSRILAARSAKFESARC